jgi:uncharacterized protein YcbK (DUF882 family)
MICAPEKFLPVYKNPAISNNPKLLRSKNIGVAQKRSLHMKEQTLVVRTTELKTKDLRDIALNPCRGGVG